MFLIFIYFYKRNKTNTTKILTDLDSVKKQHRYTKIEIFIFSLFFELDRLIYLNLQKKNIRNINENVNHVLALELKLKHTII